MSFAASFRVFSSRASVEYSMHKRIRSAPNYNCSPRSSFFLSFFLSFFPIEKQQQPEEEEEEEKEKEKVQKTETKDFFLFVAPRR
tara:strand:- start:148 stop:402 length:255 start_codon:yes stop_codon:yes gene_type:complete